MSGLYLQCTIYLNRTEKFAIITRDTYSSNLIVLLSQVSLKFEDKIKKS